MPFIMATKGLILWLGLQLRSVTSYVSTGASRGFSLYFHHVVWMTFHGQLSRESFWSLQQIGIFPSIIGGIWDISC